MAGMMDYMTDYFQPQPQAPAPQGMAPVIPDIKPRKQTKLSPDEEAKFQSEIKKTPWFQQFKQKYGEEPDVNTKDYDTREAWKQGVIPKINQNDQMYHWNDSVNGVMLKSLSHPTAWMEPFMRQYPGAAPENANDPRVAQYKQAWEAKYPSPDSVGQGAGGGGGSGMGGGS